MAVAYRASSRGTGTSNSPATTEPTGTAADDILIASIYWESSSHTISAVPSGWSAVFAGVSVGAEVSTGVAGQEFKRANYWIRRGGSAPALTWTLSGTPYWECFIASYSGAWTGGDPFSFTAFAVRDTNAASTFPAVSGTTTTANEMLVWFGTNFIGGTTLTRPTGFTSRSMPDGVDVRLADKVQASAGATGSVTGANWSGGGNGAAMSELIGLAASDPAGGGGSTYVPSTIRVPLAAVNRSSRW